MLGQSPVGVTLEQKVESFFLGVTDLLDEALDLNEPDGIFLNGKIVGPLLWVGLRQKITHLLLVDLEVADPNDDLLLVPL